MSNLVQYKLEVKDNYAVIKLFENVLGGQDALQFSSILQDLPDSNVKYLFVDLKDVQVMNSSGLGMLVGGLSNLKKDNIELILVSTPKVVSDLLEMTHLNEVFKTFENLEEAINQLS